jgi:hypothetical protein
MKATLIIVIRLVTLTVVYFICFAAVSGALLATPSERPAPTPAGAGLGALLVVSFLNTAVLSYTRMVHLLRRRPQIFYSAG